MSAVVSRGTGGPYVGAKSNGGAGGAGARPGRGFEELAVSARPALVRVAQNVTGHKEEAEDAVQASLLKAMAAWARVEGQERWRQQAYVRQIVVNTCRSSWRKWGARVTVGDLSEPSSVLGAEPLDDRVVVREALERLPARQREVLVLRYWYDLSEAQIAERLGCAPGTVKSSAARALRTLRDMLPEERPPTTCAIPTPGSDIAPNVVGKTSGPAGAVATSRPLLSA